MAAAGDNILRVEGLGVALPAGAERAYAVEDASFTLGRREVLCLVGESGSGKSITARAIMGLLPPQVVASSGRILFGDEDLLKVGPERLRAIRGSDIAMIFQEPMTALNPLMTVGNQIDEVLRSHSGGARTARRARILALLADVHLPEPERLLHAYPHQLSGGQRQRAMIAMALVLEPKIIIADEPTTALDVTTQAQILALIRELQEKHATGVLFITHDFGVVADIADRVAVMRHGRVVEVDAAARVLNAPSHPYTRLLLEAVPGGKLRPVAQMEGQPVVLSVKGLAKTFRSGGGFLGRGKRVVRALKEVSLELHRGETLGLVGESGSGKSTLARCVVRLVEPDSGEVALSDVRLTGISARLLRRQRARIQMVFQDPYASLNPRYRIGRLVADGLLINGVAPAAARARAAELLELVGIDPAALERYPHEFSGGQRQRICIARALALSPEVLVADEPVSALDVSVQAQVLRLLADLRARLHLSILFITHDLRVAAEVCDRILVMQNGEIVEQGTSAVLFTAPRHPYTRALFASIPGRRAGRDRWGQA